MHREARAHSMKKYYRLLLCSLIPLVAAALLASLFIVFTLRRQAFEQFHEVAEIYLDSIDLSLSTIQRQIRWSAMRDESFQAIANPHSLAELTDSLKTMRGQFNTLQQSTGSHFQFFGYVPADGFFFNCAALEVDYGAYLGLKERLAQLIAAPNPVYDWSLLSSRGVDYLYCIGPAQNRYIICATRLDALIEPLSALNLGPEGYVALTDAEGRALLGRGAGAHSAYGGVLLGGKIRVFPVLDGYGAYGQIALPQILTVLLALIVVGYFGASTLFLQRRVLRPIQRFADNLAALNESAGPIDLGSSEILELEQANDRFQRLIAQIRKLKIDAYERERQRQRVQLEYLQLQIKPHFFLNCMTSIHSMAQLHLDEEIQRMAAATAEYFRYIFQSGQACVPLSGELAHARNYLEIQKMRYGEALRYEIRAEDGARDVLIPPLTLQTFLENTIKHAMSLDEGLRITIRTRREGDFARLEIADTGRGFPPEVLAALQSGAPFGEDGQHIGIRNTLSRLEILFGGRASVQFRNAPEGGAQIILRIPAMRAAEEGGGGA